MQQFGPHPCTSHALLIILHVVKYLIESHKMRIDTKDNAGWTRLHVACANDHVDVVVSLVEKQGPNVEATDNDNDNWAPLHRGEPQRSCDRCYVSRTGAVRQCLSPRQDPCG
uniref:Uncharacterized protein n=1 Tax=Grammatophora oceanica TaxID=210454 RepID=A0A6U5JLS1_9STRA|mmetsp:Transcript_24626/g.36161  ORF Transcript_24626/g.36161 Transcript_24626/m.36161 type:complete len:112 (+) Transcript_24626:1245-1580(+)